MIGPYRHVRVYRTTAGTLRQAMGTVGRTWVRLLPPPPCSWLRTASLRFRAPAQGGRKTPPVRYSAPVFPCSRPAKTADEVASPKAVLTPRKGGLLSLSLKTVDFAQLVHSFSPQFREYEGIGLLRGGFQGLIRARGVGQVTLKTANGSSRVCALTSIFQMLQCRTASSSS